MAKSSSKKVVSSFAEIPADSFKTAEPSTNSNKSAFSYQDQSVVNLDDYIYSPFQIGKEDDSVAVVIDGSSFVSCCRSIESTRECMPTSISKFSVDYKKLRFLMLANFPNLKRMYYITSERLYQNNQEDKLYEFDNRSSGYSKIRSLLDFLKYNNYTVVTIPHKVNEDEAYKHNFDNLMDVEITTALFRAADVADHIVFFGAHRKFYTPLQMLFQEKGKTITVVSTIYGTKTVHDSLRQINNFVELGTPFIVERIHSDNKGSRVNNPATLEEVD